MEKGDVRWTAYLDAEDGKITYSEWILRSILTREKYNGMTWSKPIKVFYWTEKIKGLTWVKLSTKHFDWGWAKNITHWFKHDHPASIDSKRYVSKAGALKELERSTRSMLERFGEEPDEEYPDDMLYSEQLKKIKAARKRLKR